MKKILTAIVFAMMCLSASAQMPKGYEQKTAKLAENLVKCSKEGNYNKTYRLQKEQLVTFYSDIHEGVSEACEKYGIDEEGKETMWAIVDALFSDKLKESVNN